MAERVVVTGMGTINPLGHNLAETWKKAVAGVYGIDRITLFDASEFQVQIAGEVKDFSPEAGLGSKEARRRDRCEQLSAIVAQEAINQANLSNSQVDPQRVGVIVSSAIGGITSLQDTILTAFSDNPRRVRWTWHAVGGLVVIAAFLLLLNRVYRSGNEFLALALLALGLVAPGIWQLRRTRSRD